MFFTSVEHVGFHMSLLIVYDMVSAAVTAMPRSTTIHDPCKLWCRLLETWGHTGVVLFADGEPSTRALIRSVAAAREHGTRPQRGPPHSHQSQGPAGAYIGVYRGTFGARKLQLEANVDAKISLHQPCLSLLGLHVAWLMTRFNTGIDGTSPCRGELVHWKLQGRPSGRIEPRWELGVWMGKQELTDEN